MYLRGVLCLLNDIMHVQYSAGSINIRNIICHMWWWKVFLLKPQTSTLLWGKSFPKSDVLMWLLGLLVPQRKSPVSSSILHPPLIPPSPQGTGTSLFTRPPWSAHGVPCGGQPSLLPPCTGTLGSVLISTDCNPLPFHLLTPTTPGPSHRSFSGASCGAGTW